MMRTKCIGCVCSVLMASSGFAADADLGEHLSIELNATQSQDGACILSFLAQNGHPQDIDKAVFEAVLFNSDGQVDRLTLFDFGDLPSARPRVRQFVVPDLNCEALSRVIFNGVSQCVGTDVVAEMCRANLSLTSRTETEVQG